MASPSLLYAFIGTGGSLRALAVSLLCFAVDVAIFIPFVHLSNKVQHGLKEEGESMKFSKKTKLVFILVAVFLIGLAVPSYSWTRKNVKEIETFYNSKLSPIIMIPGSSATENRFDGLVRKVNQDRHGVKHSLLKVKVWNNGRITFEGKIKAKDNEPVIVIGFENNKDGYSNIKKQAKMMNQAFEALQNKYNFNNFKGLAHSNGGLIYTAFIENYLSDYDVKKKLTHDYRDAL